MKLNPKFIQYSCIEGNDIDISQAKAIIKHQPDIIIFEMPQGRYGVDTIFNKYSCLNKPLKKVDEIIKNLKISAKKYPYALSDIVVWENIKSLWQQGVNTQIYNVDSPDSLRRGNIFDKEKYSFAVKKWLFWVFLYLREIYMTKNIKTVLDTYSLKKNPIVLIFLQSVHWEHVQYLLSNPSKDNIWQYYFGRFKYIKPTKEIGREIRKNSKVLGYYWDRHQKFY